MRGLLLVGVIGTLAACSAGDAMGSGGRGNTANVAPGVAKPSAGAAGSAAPPVGDGTFGNTSKMVTMRPAVSGQDTECKEGFCQPKGADSDCGSFIVNTDVEVTQTPGNVLIVFDQSGSMAEPWQATGTTKLQAAQMALTAALMPLQDLLTVGAIFLPTYACVPALPPPPGGSVAPIDGEGQIPFQPGPQFLMAWANHWTMLPPGLAIGTPLQESFDRANAAIDSAKLTGQTIVVAFTDGAPNCFPADDADGKPITGIPTDLEVNHAATWLSQKGIKTYVVGLPGAQGVQVLNDIAMSGGTMQYILPENTMDLEMKLRSAVEETVKKGLDSCSITLSPAPAAPEKLHLVVYETANPTQGQEVDRHLSDDAGWTLSDDATSVQLTGRLCDDALAGRFDKVTFEYGCVDVPPLPPPPPVL
jgi:hypothetical protein